MFAENMEKLAEAEKTLLDLFERADIDGNGVLSWKVQALVIKTRHCI